MSPPAMREVAQLNLDRDGTSPEARVETGVLRGGTRFRSVANDDHDRQQASDSVQKTEQLVQTGGDVDRATSTQSSQERCDDPNNWGLGDDAALKELVIKIRRYHSDATRLCYISKLPLDLGFGRNDNYTMSNFVVWPKTNIAARVYVVGRLSARKFLDDKGEKPRRYVFVGVQTLSPADAIASSKICSAYRSPPQQEGGIELPNGIRFVGGGCWGSPNKDAEPCLFTNVHFAPKSLLQTTLVNARTLNRGDVVVLEMRVRKWFNDKRSAELPLAAQDRYHTMSYQLLKIYLLKKGSKDELGEWVNDFDDFDL